MPTADTCYVKTFNATRQQEAQLLQRDKAILCVVQYFVRSLMTGTCLVHRNAVPAWQPNVFDNLMTLQTWPAAKPIHHFTSNPPLHIISCWASALPLRQWLRVRMSCSWSSDLTPSSPSNDSSSETNFSWLTLQTSARVEQSSATVVKPSYL